MNAGNSDTTFADKRIRFVDALPKDPIMQSIIENHPLLKWKAQLAKKKKI